MKHQPSAPDLEKLVAELEVKLEATQAELQTARDRERRAVADYQNLVRRQQDERARIIKLAAADVVEALLEPLSHLALASDQLKNPGLTMVVTQLWQRLGEIGLEEINPVGQPFDVETMEAVEGRAPSEAGSAQEGDDAKLVVTKVIAKGYKLHGEVIRHAKVMVG